MASVSNILLDNEILLESGTNELEILVFRLGEYTFGINVAKVREVLPRGPITSLAKAHPSVLGVFSLRDTVVPVVSLRRHLQVSEGDAGSDQTMILADFNRQQTAFIVDTVERIHRLSWEQVLTVPAISSLAHSPVTAVARIDQRLVIMLDFEMITDQVTEQFFRTAMVANPLGLARNELRVLLADDSPTVREAVTKTLQASGYTQLRAFVNGREAWEWLEQQARTTRDLSKIADLLISDVEMPQIDGLHLTKRIKEHPLLKALPVLLYSSIVTPDNHKKGQAVGADAQISKPELGKVVELADGLIAAAMTRRGTTATPPVSAKTESLQAWIQPSKSFVPPLPNSATAEQSPTWEVESDEPPSETNPRIWQTYRAELADRSRHLGRQLQLLRERAGDAAIYQEVLRTLHTIKSAAMVVPVHEVTHLTHLLESMLAATGDRTSAPPFDAIEMYVDWLQDLATPNSMVASLLARGRELHQQLLAGIR